jgi:uncharacterized protein (TIGR00255 family)
VIKSMTGFASLSRENDVATIGVTLRAVNHRYLDLQVRLPQSLAALEPKLRAVAQQRLGRGRVELSVSMQLRQVQAPDVQLNQPFVDALNSVLEQARARGIIDGPLGAGDLLRMPQALVIRERSDAETEAAGNAAEIEATVVEAVSEGLAALDTMRVREGEALAADLSARRARLAALLDQVAAAAEEGQAAREALLAERTKELGADAFVEAATLAQEIVRFVARSDISEEVVRFRTHLEHWGALADGSEPCGRQLDFLLQELNREINTIGSKAEGAATSTLVVTVKTELERVREQVQNVE